MRSPASTSTLTYTHVHTRTHSHTPLHKAAPSGLQRSQLPGPRLPSPTNCSPGFLLIVPGVGRAWDRSGSKSGWVSPGASLLSPQPHMPASDPQNVTFCPGPVSPGLPSAPGCSGSGHPLAPGCSLVWLSPGALRATLQAVIGFPNSACSFVTATRSDAGRAIEALCLLPAPTLAELLAPGLSMAAPRTGCFL